MLLSEIKVPDLNARETGINEGSATEKQEFFREGIMNTLIFMYIYRYI